MPENMKAYDELNAIIAELKEQIEELKADNRTLQIEISRLERDLESVEITGQKYD